MTTADILLLAATIIGALLLFGVTVLVHELGHFIAARWMGLYVDRFAVGMGPVAWRFKRNGVEYSIRWLPLGGFVSIPQMLPMDAVEGLVAQVPKDLPAATPWAKMVTAFFGPLFSLGLGFVLAVVIFFVGENYNTTVATTTIGYVEKGSPAQVAGMLPGDQIIGINGERMESWGGSAHSIQQTLLLLTTGVANIEVERHGQRMIFAVPRQVDANPRMEQLRTVGFENTWAKPAIVERLKKGYPAQQAGLKKGDVIKQVDGQTVYCPAQLIAMVKESSASAALRVEFERDGVLHTVALTAQPVAGTEEKLLGIEFKNDFYTLRYPAPLTQVQDSLDKMWRMIKALVSPQSGVGIKHMSGPLGILDLVRQLFVDWHALISFWVFFNVNLAVLNLLPLPILDGGHILFACIEGVTRRPLNIKVVNVLMTCSMVILLLFFLMVTLNDGGRMWRNYRPSERQKALEHSMEKIETVE
ncbi:MAG: RIP metalloprotease RseP [Verrucomicrobiales bacterium]|jgi:regulator of sigma E protease|nr:RIP metalloprotease RseP [Verrucomicrobiales bacterium]